MSKKINSADNATLAGLTPATFASAQRGVALPYFAGIRKLKLNWVMEAVNVATSKKGGLPEPNVQLAPFDIGSYIVSYLFIGAINKAKSGTSSKSYYGSSAGELCCERLDFIWGILKDDGVLWPAADPFTGPTWAAESYVEFLDGHIYFTPVKTNVVPVTGGQINPPWIYEPSLPGGATLHTWVPKSWATNAIVLFNGIIYENPGAATTNFPPAAPWIRFQRLQSALPNPFPITLPKIGQAYLYWGLPAQILDTTGGELLLTEYGHPPYRWRPVLVLQDILCGSQPTMPNISVLGGRAPQQTLIGGASAELDADWQANPWCALAELLTHPVIGAGLPNSIFHAASWQAEADRCAANSALTYISPFFESAQKLRQMIPQILAYVDSFVTRGSDGLLHAGHWPHGEAPPAFVTGTIVNWDELLEEISWESDSWEGTSDSTDLTFDDITGGFQKNLAQAPNLFNRISTGRNNPRSIDRSFIIRPLQASAWATEDARQNGELFFKDILVCRAERVTAIGPGTIFELTDDLLEKSYICRCIGKTLSKPPSGIAKIQFESERGAVQLPYSATPPTPTAAQKPGPDLITDFQLVQIPDSLAVDGGSFRIIMLAARNNPAMNGFELWWNQADGTGAYAQLSSGGEFAIAATISSTIDGADVVNEAVTAASVQGNSFPLANPNLWNLTLQWSADGGTTWTAAVENEDYVVDYVGGNIFDSSGGAITDGSMIRVSYSIYISFTFNPETTSDDIEAITSALTLDQANNNTLLGFVFQVGNGQRFEILSVTEITAAGGGIYQARIIREAYNTLAGGDGSYVFGAAAGDRLFFQFRSSIIPINNAAFAPAAQNALTATFRLVPTSSWFSADLADVYNAGTNPEGLTQQFSYTFDNPYAPFVEWNAILEGGAAITVFTTYYTTADDFEIDFNLVSPSGNLFSAQIIATMGTSQITLWSQAVSGAIFSGTVQFSLPSDGAWQIYAVIKTSDEQFVQTPLSPIGGGAAVQILIGDGTVTANPVGTLSQFGGNPYDFQLTLSCSTVGASIVYSTSNPTLTTSHPYNTPFHLPTGQTTYIWAKATKAGLTDSAIVKFAFNPPSPH